MSYIAEAVSAHWGERCPDFDADCKTCAAWAEVDALESLQRENEELRRAQPYTYIGRDGKSVLARDLEDRAEAAEAGLTLLREAVGELLDQAEHVCLGAHTPANIKEAARNLATPIKNVHTALASTGGEHHGN